MIQTEYLEDLYKKKIKNIKVTDYYTIIGLIKNYEKDLFDYSKVDDSWYEKVLNWITNLVDYFYWANQQDYVDDLWDITDNYFSHLWKNYNFDNVAWRVLDLYRGYDDSNLAPFIFKAKEGIVKWSSKILKDDFKNLKNDKDDTNITNLRLLLLIFYKLFCTQRKFTHMSKDTKKLILRYLWYVDDPKKYFSYDESPINTDYCEYWINMMTYATNYWLSAYDEPSDIKIEGSNFDKVSKIKANLKWLLKNVPVK